MSAATDDKILVLIRHAKTVSNYGAYKDIERPLTSRGTEEAQVMAGWLYEKLTSLTVSPDLLLASPAQRTMETANLFAKVFERDPGIIQVDPLLYMPSVNSFYEAIEKINEGQRVLCVFSHNNGITDFVNTLTNNRIDVIPPCGVVIVKLNDGCWNNIRPVKKEWMGFNAPRLFA